MKALARSFSASPFEIPHLLVARPARVVLFQPQTLAGLDPELLLELPHRDHCSSL
jgi:hypothetical protein